MREALSLAKRKSYTRLSERKYRTESGLFLAEGERTVMQLLSNIPSPDFLEALIIRETSPESLRGALQPNSRFHLEEIPKHFHPKIYWAKKEEFDLIATTEEPQLMMGVFREPKWTIDALKLNPNRNPLIIAFDEIQDPGNAGTIIRTAAWFNASGIISGSGTVDFFNPKSVRASAGSLYSIQSVRSQNLEEALFNLREIGYEIFAADMKGTSYHEIKVQAKTVLVIGNEGKGISEQIRKLATLISIPGDAHAVESLNAGVSAAILIAHFARAI